MLFWIGRNTQFPYPVFNEFSENNIPTKARPCPMNSEYLESGKKEISLLVE